MSFRFQKTSRTRSIANRSARWFVWCSLASVLFADRAVWYRVCALAGLSGDRHDCHLAMDAREFLISGRSCRLVSSKAFKVCLRSQQTSHFFAAAFRGSWFPSFRPRLASGVCVADEKRNPPNGSNYSGGGSLMCLTASSSSASTTLSMNSMASRRFEKRSCS